MDRAVEACVRAELRPVVVVLGAVWLAPILLAEDEGGEDVQTGGTNAEVWLVNNTDWATGLASSLQTGLASLESDHSIDAVVITLVDTPSVSPQHLRRIGSALCDGATAAVATYGGEARLPVGLAREVWADVAGTVAGDEGARVWLRAHPHLVTEVECADLGSWSDIDTPADLPE